MNKQQAIWASKHDWFISYQKTNNGDYRVLAVDAVVRCENGENVLTETPVTFTDFKELYDWAGY